MSKQITTKKRETTKRYDEVANKIKKLISATGANYIPELSEALREDWYPHLSTDMIQTNAGVQNEIRDKILKEWSYEHGNETPWSDWSIKHWLPDWLKDAQAIARGDESYKSRALKKFQKGVEEKRKLLEKTVEQLPNPPKEIQKETFEITDNSQIRAQIEQDPLFQKLGDTGQNAYDQYGKIYGPLQDLIEGLTHQRLIPLPDEDRFNEYIKPTRDEFMAVYHEVDKRMQVGLYNGFVYLKELLEDRIEQMDKVRLKK